MLVAWGGWAPFAAGLSESLRLQVASFELEPFVTVPGPTLAENHPQIDQNESLDFSFLI